MCWACTAQNNGALLLNDGSASGNNNLTVATEPAWAAHCKAKLIKLVFVVLQQNPETGMSNPRIHPILSDHLGTPRKVLDGSTGKTLWSWDAKDPFGHELPQENPDGLGVFVLDLRFPGQQFDKETGLFHNGFRTYSPKLGRYIQSDPLGLEAGWNTYVYVGSNPLGGVDPLGLKIIYTGHNSQQTINLLSQSVQKSKTLYNIISRLHQSEKTYEIRSIQNGRNEYDPATNTIFWNSSKINQCLDFSEMLNENRIRNRYPAESLYHELIHAYFDDKNMLIFDSILNYEEESRAVNGENVIRQEMGYPDSGRHWIEYYLPWGE